MTRYEDPVRTLREALETRWTVPELKLLAGAFASRPPARKAELVSLILEQAQGDALRRTWDRLDKLQRHAVCEVVHGYDYRLNPGAFRAKYGALPMYGGSSPLGVFFQRSWVMPNDLRDSLRAWVPAPPACRLATVAEPPAIFAQPWRPARSREDGTEDIIPVLVRECAGPALHEVHGVLRAIQEGRIAVSDRTRRPGAPAIRALNPVLAGGDFYPEGTPADGQDPKDVGPIRAFAWPLLVQAAGFAQLRGTRLELTPTGRSALNSPAAPTLRRLWERWLETTLLDELSRIDPIKGQTGSQAKRSLTALGPRREAIAGGLAECPVGEWVALDELFRFLRGAGYDFEIARNRWPLYICEPEYGSLGYDDNGGWHILQARYALCFLFEYAATLGVVDVAYVPPAGARPDYVQMWGTDDLAFLSRYDGLVYLRLTPLGAYCLGLDASFDPPTPAQVLRVLGNLDIVAPHGLAPADESALDRYALRASDIVWRLDRGLLLGLVEEGTAIAEVRAFLAERCDGPLPELAARLLADTEASASRIRDAGVARIVACDDPALVALVLNDAGTRPFCLPAGDRHLAIPGPGEPAFRRALRKLGYAISPAAQEGLAQDGLTPEHRPRASPASRRGAGQG